MDRIRLLSIFRIIPLIALVFVCCGLPVSGEDWLDISGEKGFSFSYLDGSGSSNWLGQGLTFSQSLLLDLKGGFGEDYRLDGHLADQPNAPLQLFFSLKGEKAGLQFGNGNLGSFSTGLTPWSGEFNGLEGYLQNNRHQLKLAYANPTGIPVKESVIIKSGRNYAYLSYRPLRQQSLKVFAAGKQLSEGLDYTVDYFTGELKLLAFMSDETRLDLDYQYIPGSVLGNQFIAVKEQSTWDRYKLGVEYFGSQSQQDSGPILLGETKKFNTFDLIGANSGFHWSGWDWDVEYWASQERKEVSGWDYIDSMDGEEIATELFPGSSDPLGWNVYSTGSGCLGMSKISPFQDVRHTRDNQLSLVLNCRLQRTGDAVGIYHDFGVYRDFNRFSVLNFWIYLNGQNLELEVQLITSENNYYFERFSLSQKTGWQQLAMLMDPLRINRMGLADLGKIRYLKLHLSSPSGDDLNDTIYLAPLIAVEKSSAVQRWSKTETSPGGSIVVHSVSELVAGSETANQVLQLDYSIPAEGWISVAYQPAMPIDLSRYRKLKFYLNSTGSLRLTVLAGRGEVMFSLGQVEVVTAGAWSEYLISLDGVAERILERVETIALKIDNVSGTQLKIDSIRATDRSFISSGAVKTRGEYTAGPWRNLVELARYNPGFQDMSSSYHVSTQNLRNLTEYTTETWRIRSDLQMYNKADLSSGYPVDGEELALEVQHQGTVVSFNQNADKLKPGDGDCRGNRNESRLGLGQSLGNWNIDYTRNWSEDSIVTNSDRQGDGLQVRYQKDNWWGWTKFWQESSFAEQVLTKQLGNNIGLGFDPPGINRFQLNGGVVNSKSGVSDITRNFWQSDLACEITRGITVNGSCKFEDQRENATGIKNDLLSNLGLTLLPIPQWNVRFDFQTRNWEDAASGASWQYIREFQTGYFWDQTERIAAFCRLEELQTLSGRNDGARVGINGEIYLKTPWLTQFTLELNTNRSANTFTAARQRNYKASIKNSLKQDQTVFYWGFWMEGADEEQDLLRRDRRMAQAGWEKVRPNDWSWGVDLDRGVESLDQETESIWGTGAYITFDNQQQFLQLKLRYQTYTDVLWKASLLYRLYKGQYFSLNWQNDYLQDLSAGRALVLRLDLLFYFH
jgi:hypothetical protein